MVAVAERTSVAAERGRSPWWWGVLGVSVVGMAARVALGGFDVGDRSALVMTLLLVLGVGLAAWLVTKSPRAVFITVLFGVFALDLAALPVRNPPEYDEREALYRTDQSLGRSLAVPSSPATLTLLAQAVWPADRDRPGFDVGADVGWRSFAWRCGFTRQIQRLALPLPADAVNGQSNVDVHVKLTGTPSRETDYLLVYSSSRVGGYLMSLVPASSQPQDATICSLA